MSPSFLLFRADFSPRCPLNGSVLSARAERRGDLGAQVFVRVDRRIVNSHFVVQVRSGAASAHSDVSDHLPLAHRLPIRHREAGQMSVASGYSVSVINLDQAPIPTIEAGIGDHPVGRRHDRLTVTAGNVDTRMERTLS